jgi:hypothetical protein
MTMVKSTSRRRGRRPGQPDETLDPGSPAEDWNAISVGSAVEVSQTGGHSYVGRVDAKTPDSGIVWVVSFTGLGRQMYGSRDGVRLRSTAWRNL